MAMQASLGATKFVVLFGAGLVGSVLVRNSRVTEFFTDLSKVRRNSFPISFEQGFCVPWL
jgi:hypothetical protein